MKHLYVIKYIIILTLSMSRCSTKETTEYLIDLKYYKIGREDVFNETATVKMSRSKDLVRWVYKYNYLQEINDTLIMTKSSTMLNNRELLLQKKQKFNIGTLNYEVSKYKYDAVYASSNIYIIDSLGIIMKESISSEGIVEYGTENNVDKLRQEILKDSLF